MKRLPFFPVLGALIVGAALAGSALVAIAQQPATVLNTLSDIRATGMSYGNCVIVPIDNSTVMINWPICERWASEDPNGQTGVIARLMLAIRDGKWRSPEAAK